jgi:hypothetical protein
LDWTPNEFKLNKKKANLNKNYHLNKSLKLPNEENFFFKTVSKKDEKNVKKTIFSILIIVIFFIFLDK